MKWFIAIMIYVFGYVILVKHVITVCKRVWLSDWLMGQAHHLQSTTWAPPECVCEREGVAGKPHFLLTALIFDFVYLRCIMS